MCYNNHINSTRIQSIASMALTVFPDVPSLFVLTYIRNPIQQCLFRGNPTHLVAPSICHVFVPSFSFTSLFAQNYCPFIWLNSQLNYTFCPIHKQGCVRLKSWNLLFVEATQYIVPCCLSAGTTRSLVLCESLPPLNKLNTLTGRRYYKTLNHMEVNPRSKASQSGLLFLLGCDIWHFWVTCNSCY